MIENFIWKAFSDTGSISWYLEYRDYKKNMSREIYSGEGEKRVGTVHSKGNCN